MADPKDSVLDKAENAARRILERLGSTVDNKLTSANQEQLKPEVIADLTSRVEHAIESSLEEDESGIRRVAPNRLRVLFTYEETSALSPQYIELVGKELTATALEYTNNRRYVTRGPIVVEVGRDLFAKTTSVKASFESGSASPGSEKQAGSGPESRTVCFKSSDGKSYRIDLRLEGAPAYIGRASGNALRIDDPSVSRLHCSLSLRVGGIIVIADVGSINGTTVNEHLLGRDEAHPLRTSDVVGVGDFKLTILEIT
jgi:hypothetical protein